MSDRRSLSKRQRRGILFRQSGCCALCDRQINLARGDRFEIDHAIPLALGGADQLSNYQAICVACHSAKTKNDVRDIAKAKRVRAKYEGTYRAPRYPLPGGIKTPWKRKLNGKTERREPRNEGG